MPSTEPQITNEVFLVHDLLVDVARQSVKRAGIEITLPYLSFQLLLALIRAAPDILSNEEVMARVWPGLIVSPETVVKRVNLLRDALGDNAQDPRYVAGVRGRGYRLVATVSFAPAPASTVDQVQPVGQSAEDAKPVGPQAASTGKRWTSSFVAVVALAIMVAIGFVLHQRQQARIEGAQPVAEGSTGQNAAIGERARTVAVLPFENISADAADAYLARGLSEMILNRLSKIDGLSVIARDSSFVVDTRKVDSRDIGRRLNSGYLIGGSVQREADRLRVTVHLVDTAEGTLVWSAKFDRGLHEIFSVEDEIAEQLAAALSVRIGERESNPPPTVRSTNLEAYLAYLKGRTLLGRLTVTESEAAVPYFEKAIALDQNFASAYASLYDARMQAADRRREDLRLARKRYGPLIDRAIELDPNLGAAYFARAMWGEVPYDASATSDNPLIVALASDFRRGATLDPSNGRGLEAYAGFLRWTLQRPEEGAIVLKHALWVDPMSPSAHFIDAEFSLDDSGVTLSERKTLQVLELDPNFVPALLRYGRLRWMSDGKLAEAIQFVEHGIALDPHNSMLRHVAMTLYLDLGDVQAARAVVAGMPQSPRAIGLMAMHDGDWRRAGLSAFDEGGWTRDTDVCEIWQSEALRDYALKTGELNRTIAFIRSKYYLADAPEEQLDVCTNGAAVHLSQLLAAAGQARQALALRRAASSWNDANEARYLGGSRRLRAGILLLDGKRDAALAELAESFRSGFYAQWWYTLDYDPLWLPLHDDARFKAIAADVRRYIDAQRGQFEALRRQGVVPKRDDPAAVH